MPDSLSPFAFWGEPLRWPDLDERFLPPAGFLWGRFIAADGAELRWGYLPVPGARAQCVLVGGFGEFIEKHLETIRDLAARKIEVWCLDWRGQGRSARPRHFPTRPRPRNFDRDAEDLGTFAAAKLVAPLPRLLIAHSMGGAIALLCLHRYPKLFAAAILSSPMLGFRLGGFPPALLRCITAPARAMGFGTCLVPGARKWRATCGRPEETRLSTDAPRCGLKQAWLSADPALRLEEPTYGWLDSALSLVGRIQQPQFLRHVRTPILMVTPEHEFVVCPAAQRQAAVFLPNCKLVELAGSRHDPMLERDPVRYTWLRHVDNFLGERLDPGVPRNMRPEHPRRPSSPKRQAA